MHIITGSIKRGKRYFGLENHHRPTAERSIDQDDFIGKTYKLLHN